MEKLLVVVGFIGFYVGGLVLAGAAGFFGFGWQYAALGAVMPSSFLAILLVFVPEVQNEADHSELAKNAITHGILFIFPIYVIASFIPVLKHLI